MAPRPEIEFDPEKWVRLEQTVERIAHLIDGNGQPALEKRLMKYADDCDEHKKRGMEDALGNMTQTQNARHEENGRKFDRLFMLVYIGMGIILALQFVGLLIFKKG